MTDLTPEEQNKAVDQIIQESEKMLSDVQVANTNSMQVIDGASKKADEIVTDLKQTFEDMETAEEKIATQVTEAVAEDFERIAKELNEE